MSIFSRLTDIVQSNLTYATGHGYYSDPYKTLDQRPDTRRVLAWQARYNHQFAALDATLQLGYRPPFDWEGILQFLRARTLRGVERIDGDAYLRTVQLGSHTGWISVRNSAAKRVLQVELPHSLTPVLPALLGRLRNLFDLSARPDLISEQLMRDPMLTDIVAGNPGMRVPGAFDGFELAVRAVLGQQISVKAATTLAGRFINAFGEKIATPHESLTHLAPSAQRIAELNVDDIASLGVIRSRARSVIALAADIASGKLELDAGAEPESTMKQLTAISGIGKWTAHYIAMRALRWPDAFPKEDVVLRNILGRVTAARAEELSQPWRPWRSYATLHLWRVAASSTANSANRSHAHPEPAARIHRDRVRAGRR